MSTFSIPRDSFEKIVRDNIHRDGIEELLTYLDESDFYTCPASAKYHGSNVGGLVEHSLEVYNELKRLLKAYPEIEVSEETVAIVALFHDLCKIGLYKVEYKNRKNDDGKWEQSMYYTYDEKFHFGGHGSKSVYIVQNYIKLTQEEAAAINCHMGSWDGNKDVADAYQQFPIAWLLHVADEASTFLLKK